MNNKNNNFFLKKKQTDHLTDGYEAGNVLKLICGLKKRKDKTKGS
jgi:hypothetical protein